MSIEKEVIQYGITAILEKLFVTKDEYKRYEYLNCLERWVLSMASDTVYRVIDKKDPVNKKLAEEFKSKHLPNLTNRILSIVHNNLNKEPHIIKNNTRPYNDEDKDDQGWIVDIKIKYFPNIYIKIPIPKQKYNAFLLHTKDSMTLMFLRYSTLINRGQQWALPQDQFYHLSKKYGVNYEGFASPLNSGLYLTGGKFCSLFKDTDKIFGSVGNFFDQALYADHVDSIVITNINNERKNNKIKHWVVNPPFIVSILDETSDKILNDLEVASELCIGIMVVYIMPSWTDFEGYIKIQNSKFLKHTQNLEKKKHFYEHMGKRNIVNSKSTMFVLDTYNEETDYSDIAKPMML